MGTYVYALNTKVRTISNVTVGVAEYRYKLGWGGRDGNGTLTYNERMHNRTCARRIAFFDNNKLPFFFVMNKLEEGVNVYSHLDKQGRLVGPCFDDGGNVFNKVGTIKKSGRGWAIDWI